MDIKHIKFDNRNRPRSDFDLVRLEELLDRKIDHSLTQTHKIAFFNILVITHGRGTHNIDFGAYPYQRGTLLTIRKDQLQRFSRAPDVEGYLLLFTEDFLASHYGKTEVLRAFHLFNEQLASPKIDLEPDEFEEILELVSIIQQDYYRAEDEFSIGIIRSALHLLVMKLFRFKARREGKLTRSHYLDEFLRLQQLIEGHCFATKKALDYARMMNRTTKTLNNICRTVLGKSAKALIDDILITQIKRLLINTQLSITEVAYTAGFEEPTNFYKYFKRHVRSSPEAFRRIHA
ncbi:MAG: helix-turn-helix domain-containing protein [Bacteroidota bacterium]